MTVVFSNISPKGNLSVDIKRKFFIFLQNYLHISIKSSIFAAKFVPKM